MSESKPSQTNLSYLSAGIMALSSAFLAALAFPPCRMIGLVWIALIPWLYSLPRLTLRQMLFSHGVFVACFFGIGISWMKSVHPVCPFVILIPLYFLCLPFPFFYRWFVRDLHIPVIFAAPVMWTVNEYLRSFLLTGFPWLYLGHTQAFWPLVIQIADITGVYGVTFIIVLCNALLLCWLEWFFRRRQSGEGFKALIGYTAGTIILFALVGFYGSRSLQNISYTFGPRICAIQGNIPQDIKENPNENSKKILESYTTLSLQALQIKDRPDLLVWPETMSLMDPQSHAQTYAMFKDIASLTHVPMLIGSHYFELSEHAQQRAVYNSAYLFDAAGNILDRYDKIRLVILGEYIPQIPFLSSIVRAIVGFASQLSAGIRRTVFELGDYRFSTLICYEIVYAEDARAARLQGSQFIINLTNEGWFAHSCELEQILQSAIFRAIENRIGILRSGNTGITLTIPPDGRIARERILTMPIAEYGPSLPPYMQERIAGQNTWAWHHFPEAMWSSDIDFVTPLAQNWDIALDGQHLKWKDFAGIFCQTVPLATPNLTFYTRMGDVFAQALLLLSLVWVGMGLVKWHNTKSRQFGNVK